jgi:hypothetical protein
VLEVKSIDRLLETPISYAYAVKAGPWVFLTGHEAYAWVTGIPDEVIGPPGFPLYGRDRSRREGDFILQRMGRVLGEFGSDLAHSVRLDQYYPNPKAVAAYHLSRHAEFHDYIPPSTSVVMERCFAAPATISTSLIAVMPEAGYEIRKVHPPGVASAPTSGFVPAVVCDEFVFVLTSARTRYVSRCSRPAAIAPTSTPTRSRRPPASMAPGRTGGHGCDRERLASECRVWSRKVHSSLF